MVSDVTVIKLHVVSQSLTPLQFAVPCLYNYFCLGSSVEFYCKTCFEVLRIASPGTKIKMFRENN